MSGKAEQFGYAPFPIAGLVAGTHGLKGDAKRRQVLLALAGEPGCTKSELVECLGIPWGTLSHHLRRLESERRVVKRKIFGATRWYVWGTTSFEMELHPLLREPNVHLLVQGVRSRPGIGIQSLANQLSLNPKSVRRLVRCLVHIEVLQASDEYHPGFTVSTIFRDVLFAAATSA
jgi:predicted transcriptional regulator